MVTFYHIVIGLIALAASLYFIDNRLNIKQKIMLTLTASTVSVLLIDMLLFTISRQTHMFYTAIVLSLFLFIVQRLRPVDQKDDNTFNLTFAVIMNNTLIIYAASFLVLIFVSKRFSYEHFGFQLFLIVFLLTVLYVLNRYIKRTSLSISGFYAVILIWIILMPFIISFDTAAELPFRNDSQFKPRLVHSKLGQKDITNFVIDDVEDYFHSPVDIAAARLHQDTLYILVNVWTQAENADIRYELHALDLISNNHQIIHVMHYTRYSIGLEGSWGVYELINHQDTLYLLGPSGLYAVEKHGVIPLYIVDKELYPIYPKDYDYALYLYEDHLIYSFNEESYAITDMTLSPSDISHTHDTYVRFSAFLEFYYIERTPNNIRNLYDINLNMVFEDDSCFINQSPSQMAIFNLFQPHFMETRCWRAYNQNEAHYFGDFRLDYIEPFYSSTNVTYKYGETLMLEYARRERFFNNDTGDLYRMTLIDKHINVYQIETHEHVLNTTELFFTNSHYLLLFFITLFPLKFSRQVKFFSFDVTDL